MAFGFPAYHSENFEFSTGRQISKEIVKDAIQLQGWSLTGVSEDFVSASCCLNLLSWGEGIRVAWLSGTRISITSKCSLPTQCVDWGRNKSNVLSLITRLERAEQSSVKPASTVDESN